MKTTQTIADESLALLDAANTAFVWKQTEAPEVYTVAAAQLGQLPAKPFTGETELDGINALAAIQPAIAAADAFLGQLRAAERGDTTPDAIQSAHDALGAAVVEAAKVWGDGAVDPSAVRAQAIEFAAAWRAAVAVAAKAKAAELTGADPGAAKAAALADPMTAAPLEKVIGWWPK